MTIAMKLSSGGECVLNVLLLNLTCIYDVNLVSNIGLGGGLLEIVGFLFMFVSCSDNSIIITFKLVSVHTFK